MEPSVLNEIVEILLTDNELILNWRKLFDGLNSKAEDRILLERQVNNRTIKSYELFSKILSIWSSTQGSEATLNTLKKILDDNGFRLVADKLNEERALKRPKNNLPIWFEIGRTTRSFVGRTKELEELTKLFKSQNSVLVTTTGMGGVGKSELVKNFAKCIAETESASCIWLNGETRESLKNSVTRLENFVKPTKLDVRQPLDVQFCNIVSAIKTNARILVIVDNVDDANEEVHRLISNVPESRCFFLVTSRNVGVLEFAGTIIRLDILPDKEAVDLLKKTGIEEPDNEIKTLCTLLGNFPLALHQAAAYIKMQKLTDDRGESYRISDYIKIYETQQRTLLRHKLSPIEHDYTETTLTTWNMSFEKIKKNEKLGSLAIQLLNTIAYFQPDGIDVEFLNLYQNGLEEAVQLIKTYSLVKVKNGQISMHRLIQQVIRLNLISDQLETQQLTKIIQNIQQILETTESFVGLSGRFHLESYGDKSVDVERSFIYIEGGMGHIVSVWKYAAKYFQLIVQFQAVFLETVNGLKYFKLFELIVDICHATQYQLNNTLGLNMELKLRIESELFNAQAKFNKHLDDKSLFGLKTVYARQSSIFGEDNNNTLITAHYIATMNFKNLNKVSAKIKSELFQWCRNIVDVKTKVFGPLHKSTLSTKLLLAENSEHNQETANLYEECLQWQMTHLGVDRISTHDIFTNYVRCLTAIGEYEKARCVLEQYLQQELRHAFKDSGFQELSFVLFHLGKTEDAFSALQRAIRNKDHISQFELALQEYKEADLLLNRKHYSEALNMYSKLEIRQFSRDWRSIDIEHKISLCLFGLHRYIEARDILQNICRLQRFEGNGSKPMSAINMLLEEINRRVSASQDESIEL